MEDHFSSKLSPLVDYAAGAFLIVVAVLSFVGNTLVLITAYKRRNHVKPPELLSVNLAVTDLGAAVTMYPLAVISSWSHRWVGGQPSCLYYGLMGLFFGVASITTLTEMAVVRFIVSLSVHSPREKISRRKVHMLIVSTWLYGLLWALLPLLGWGQYGPEPFGTSCSLAWGDLGRQDSSFVFAMFTMVLVIPAVIIIVCYFGLALKLHLAYKSINNSMQIPNVIKTQRKLMLIAVLVSVGFIGSWTPYAVVSLWSALHHSGDSPSSSIPAEVGLLPCLFAKSSTVFNPLVYYVYSSNFRNEVRNLWRDCWRAINKTQQDSCVLAQHDWNKPPLEQNGGTDCLPLQAVGGESKGNGYSLTPATLVQMLHTEGHVDTEL